MKQTDNRSKLTLVSLGQHTRAGDALEFALQERTFVSCDLPALENGSGRNALLLLALSDTGGEEALRLRSALERGSIRLDGAVCVLLADESCGGALHDDALRLLLQCNRAGAFLPPYATVEAAHDLGNIAHMYPEAARVGAYEGYLVCARTLVERLCTCAPHRSDRARLRFVSTIDNEGLALDWREAIAARLPETLALTNEGDADAMLLLCENERALPNEQTLAALDEPSQTPLYIVAGSAHIGADSFLCRVLDRACLQNGRPLPPCFSFARGGSDAQTLLARSTSDGSLKEWLAKASATLTGAPNA